MKLAAVHRRHFIFLNIAHVFNHYLVLILPTVALFLHQQWAMSYAHLLKLGSLGAFTYALGVMPAGWLADKIGRVKVMTVYFFGLGIFSLLAGISQTPLQLMIAVAGIGFFAASYHPVGTSLVYGLSSQPSRLMAINGVSGNIGLALAALGTSYISHHLGWRYSFIIPGLLAIIMGLFYWWFTASNDLRTSLAEPNHSDDGFAVPKLIKAFSCILLISICGGLIYNSMTTALPKILLETSLFQHDSMIKIGGVATLMLAAASLAQLIAGELLMKFKPVLILGMILLCESIAAILLYLSPHSLVFIFAILVFTFAQIPVNDFIIGQCAPAKWRSRLYALKYTIVLITGVIAYWLIALTLQWHNDFDFMYLILAGVMMMSLPAVFLLYQLIKHR
ncbi:MAG: MFS transporter [Parashewanella sp.]